MTRRTLLALAALCLGGCAFRRSEIIGFPPRISQAERAEIEAAAALRSEYFVATISEMKSGGWDATLVRRDRADRGMILNFERAAGHMVEDKARAKEVDFIVP
jgi:hypothetical protein